MDKMRTTHIDVPMYDAPENYPYIYIYMELIIVNEKEKVIDMLIINESKKSFYGTKQALGQYNWYKN